jgi:hypothetical protein
VFNCQLCKAIILAIIQKQNIFCCWYVFGSQPNFQQLYSLVNMPENLKIEHNANLQHRIFNTVNFSVIPLKGFFEEVTNLTLFTLRFFKEAIKPPYEFREFLKQC